MKELNFSALASRRMTRTETTVNADLARAKLDVVVDVVAVAAVLVVAARAETGRSSMRSPSLPSEADSTA